MKIVTYSAPLLLVFAMVGCQQQVAPVATSPDATESDKPQQAKADSAEQSESLEAPPKNSLSTFARRKNGIRDIFVTRFGFPTRKSWNGLAKSPKTSPLNWYFTDEPVVAQVARSKPWKNWVTRMSKMEAGLRT